MSSLQSAQSTQTLKRKRADDAEFIIRKRIPQRLPTLETDIYVSRKSNMRAQIARAQKLLDTKGLNYITIHGLGAALGKAIELAMQLQSRYLGSLVLSVQTSTVNLIDDVDPKDDDLEPDIQVRQNSAIHIKISKTSSKKSDKKSTSSKSATKPALSAATSSSIASKSTTPVSAPTAASTSSTPISTSAAAPASV